MKIVLIGFMGTGKSSVAPLLADKLGLEAVEMDDLILKRAGRGSIADIFAADGEAGFRRLEAAVGKELGGHDGIVVSTGGGVVTDERLMGSLAHGAIVVGLEAPFEVTLRRAQAQGKARPLLADISKAQALYKARQPLYNKYAAFRVDTDGKSVDEVVQEIIVNIRRQSE